MNKSKKFTILDELIKRVSNLTYDVNSHPETSVINDTLSFIRNTIDDKNAVEWKNKINNINWGVPHANSIEMESKRKTRWHEGRNKFIGILQSIKQEIEHYSQDEIENTSSVNNTDNNSPIIFLSHSSTDKSYGDALENFITGLGVKKEHFIYTSHPMHKIPLDVNIFDYLRKNISKNIFMLILWSDTYLDSPACLIEMGAAWVSQSNYTNIFTPNFNFNNPKYLECAIDIRKMGIVLNGDDICKSSMIELKNKIVSLFGLSIDETQSTYLLDKFIKEIINIKLS